MPLISCPVCAKDVSASAPTCPSCGHPIASNDSGRELKAVLVKGGAASGLGAVVLLMILVLVIVIAVASKPSEGVLKDKLREKYGAIYGIGVVAEKFGLLEMRYHDYGVFSSLSIQLIGEPERTVAYGFLGQTVFPNDGGSLSRVAPPKPTPPSTSVRNLAPTIEPERDAEVRPESVPVGESAGSKSPSMSPGVDPTADAEPPQDLESVRQTLVENEMQQQANFIFAGRHPLSKIESCEIPVVESVDLPQFGELVTVIFSCRMRGKLLGESLFLVSVRARGAVMYTNGKYVGRFYGTDVIADQQIR